MALIDLENGKLLDAPTLNDNFHYLDGKINESTLAITGGSSTSIASLASSMQTSDSNIKAMVPAGTVIMHAGDINIAMGYLLCDGRPVSREKYRDLFNAIGTIWGAGDGSTTFNLPNINNASFPCGWTNAGNRGDGDAHWEGASWSLSADGVGNHQHSVSVYAALIATSTGEAGGHEHSISGQINYIRQSQPKHFTVRYWIKY